MNLRDPYHKSLCVYVNILVDISLSDLNYQNYKTTATASKIHSQLVSSKKPTQKSEYKLKKKKTTLKKLDKSWKVCFYGLSEFHISSSTQLTVSKMDVFKETDAFLQVL